MATAMPPAQRGADATNAHVTPGVEEAVRALAAQAAARDERLVLAVSGGRDSMVLLDAMYRVAPAAVAAVATFDHGTGAAATAAADFVAEECGRRALPLVRGAAALAGATEAAWREARWRFLREAARRARGRVVTAHTRDDNLETVLMRIMRGSSARGLAALHAPGPVARPFIELRRDDVARHAAANRVGWVEDPSNQSLRFLRNRVRREILPALLAVCPTLGGELLEIARRAARFRLELAHVVDRIAPVREGDALVVAAAALADYDAEALRLLWPELAARAGVVLDRRGTAGLARFTTRAGTGDRMQLSGAIEVLRRRDAIVLAPPATESVASEGTPLRADADLAWGAWRFRGGVTGGGGGAERRDAWTAVLAPRGELRVRAWRPGDRMLGAGDAAPRRVKRFMRDAGLAGPERVGWPVVVDDEEIVWIPGVRRSDAATVRSGRPEAVYVCERIEPRREG